MSTEVYELIARAMRYWFLFLMALIVWRCWRCYLRDRRQSKKQRRLLPDAGYVGELIVVEGGGVLRTGEAFSVPREGTLGFLRTNDLCIPVDGVRNKHLWFMYDEDDGLMIEPFAGNKAEVDGNTSESRRVQLYMAHGSLLRVGEAELRLRFFAGFETAVHAPIHDDYDEAADDERENGSAYEADAAPCSAYAIYANGYEQMAAQAAAQGLTPEQYMQVQAWAAQNYAVNGVTSATGAYSNISVQPPNILTPEQQAQLQAWLAQNHAAAGAYGLTPEQQAQAQAWLAQNYAQNLAANGIPSAPLTPSANSSYGNTSAQPPNTLPPEQQSQPQTRESQNRSVNSASSPIRPGKYMLNGQIIEIDDPNAPQSQSAYKNNEPDIPTAPPRSTFAPSASSPPLPPSEPANQIVLSTDEGFYPPENDTYEDEWDGADYPDYGEDDLPDAMQPPRSAYIGHDDAELAKKLVWDRYLGRGRRK